MFRGFGKKNRMLRIRCSFEVERRFKTLSAKLGLPFGDCLKHLLDYYEGKVPREIAVEV